MFLGCQVWEVTATLPVKCVMVVMFPATNKHACLFISIVKIHAVVHFVLQMALGDAIRGLPSSLTGAGDHSWCDHLHHMQKQYMIRFDEVEPVVTPPPRHSTQAIQFMIFGHLYKTISLLQVGVLPCMTWDS